MSAPTVYPVITVHHHDLACICSEIGAVAESAFWYSDELADRIKREANKPLLDLTVAELLAFIRTTAVLCNCDHYPCRHDSDRASRTPPTAAR